MPKFQLQAGSLTPKSERSRRRAQRLLSRAHRKMAATVTRIAQEQLSGEKLALAKATESDKLADEVMRAIYAEFAALAESLRQPLVDAAISGVSETALQVEITDAGMLATSNEAARAWAQKRAAEMVGMKWINGALVPNPNAKWEISDTIRDELRKIFEKAFASEKAPLEEIIQAIKEAGSFSEARAEMIARTEVSRAQISGNLALWKQSGMVEMYTWLLSEDEGVCDQCQEIADNGPYELGKGPIPIDDSHPNCVIGSTIVSSPSTVVALTRRWFHGEVFIIECFDGTEITITPNHPVLTNNGWIAAGEIKENSYLVKCALPDKVQAAPFAFNPNHELMPVIVEEIFGALLESGAMSAVSMPTSAEDFHGDGTANGEVDIVRTDGELPDTCQPNVIQEPGEECLVSAHSRRMPLPSDRRITEIFESARHTQNGGMSGGGSLFPLPSRGLAHPSGLSFADSANLQAHAVKSGSQRSVMNPQFIGDSKAALATQILFMNSIDHSIGNHNVFFPNAQSIAPESASKGMDGDSNAIGKALGALAGCLQLMQVRNVSRNSFSGHVYNLQTQDEYYVANGIITHNCRCIMASNEIAEPKAASQQIAINKQEKEPHMGIETTTEKAVDAGRFYLSIPITKFDEEQRIVEGIATAEVLDTQGDIVDFPAAIDAFKSWEGNIREQHDPKKAVGRAIEWSAIDDNKAIRLSARISKGAQDTWEKVKDGTLKYFSIGSPFGSFERKPETMKVAGGADKTVNRLFLKALSEVSLVDQGACPAAKIELVKSDGVRSEALAEDEPAPVPPEAAPAEKITEDASNYADPGWQDDKQKRYPLDTEDHVKAAASYFGRPRNRKKYSADQQKKIDAKIEAAKKKFKIGEYAEKSDGTMDLCKYADGNFSPVEWISLNDYNPEAATQVTPTLYYVPRTFGDVWEDTEDASIFPVMGQMLGRTIANILSARIPGEEQKRLIQQSFDEFIEEIEDELMEADEQAAEEGARKFTRPGLTKAGARNSKSDLDTIQGMHDSAVKLGAVCQKEEKSATSDIDGIMKALAPLKQLTDTQLIVMTQEQIQKLASGAPLDKVMEAVATKTLEVKTELETKLADKADKADIAKEQEKTTRLEGDIAAVKTDLEAVKKEPASLPIVKSAQLEKFLFGAAGATGNDEGDLTAAIDQLSKMQASESDAILKEKLGMRIGELKFKQQMRGR